MTCPRQSIEGSLARRYWTRRENADPRLPIHQRLRGDVERPGSHTGDKAQERPSSHCSPRWADRLTRLRPPLMSVHGAMAIIRISRMMRLTQAHPGPVPEPEACARSVADADLAPGACR